LVSSASSTSAREKNTTTGVFLLGDGGGLDIKPTATRADLLDIDEPQGANPLRETLRLAVLSGPIPQRGRAVSWLSAEARGSEAPAGRVRYVRELTPMPEHLSD